jgi:hypothetical protein
MFSDDPKTLLSPEQAKKIYENKLKLARIFIGILLATNGLS